MKEHFKVPWKENPSAKVLEVIAPASVASDQPQQDEVKVEPAAAVESNPAVDTASPPEEARSETGATKPTEASSQETSAPPEPHERVLHLHNFEKALKEITPSSSESLGSLADLRKWNDEFGEGRRGKKRSPWGRGLFGFVDAKKAFEVPAEGKVAASTSTPTPPPSS